jgi:hypothetical protein
LELKEKKIQLILLTNWKNLAKCRNQKIGKKIIGPIQPLVWDFSSE